MTERRDEFWDVVKGIGIVAVYLGHTLPWGTLASRIIYDFHMPLFFFVSGALFKPEKFKSAGEIVRSIVLGLFLPYVVFVTMANAICWDFYGLKWRENLMSCAWATLVHGYGAWSLWFLTCLASVKMTMWTIHRLHFLNGMRKWGILTVVAVVAHVIWAFSGNWLHRSIRLAPFMALSVPCSLVFFLSGNFLREVVSKWVQMNRMWQRWLFCGLSFGFLIASAVNVPIPFDLRIARFPAIALVPCAFGLMFVFSLASLMRGVCLRRLLAFWGKFSLCMFALEPILAFVYARILNLWGLNLPEVDWAHGQVSWNDILVRNVVVIAVVSLLSPPLMTMIRSLKGVLTTWWRDDNDS